jgi:argininosuccinate synthase
MKALNKLGGKHGVGRVDMVENRFVGMKSRGVYETPGGASCTSRIARWNPHDGPRGHAPARRADPEVCRTGVLRLLVRARTLALQAYVEESQKNVTGTVRVKLYKGNIIVAGRKSKVSLYNPHIATMEADPTKAYNQDDATGFIRLNGLRLRVNVRFKNRISSGTGRGSARTVQRNSGGHL